MLERRPLCQGTPVHIKSSPWSYVRQHVLMVHCTAAGSTAGAFSFSHIIFRTSNGKWMPVTLRWISKPRNRHRICSRSAYATKHIIIILTCMSYNKHVCTACAMGVYPHTTRAVHHDPPYIPHLPKLHSVILVTHGMREVVRERYVCAIPGMCCRKKTVRLPFERTVGVLNAPGTQDTGEPCIHAWVATCMGS